MSLEQLKDLDNVIRIAESSQGTRLKFCQRTLDESFTRDENPQSHFCVYFAAFDPKAHEVFMGHHKKSGLWIVNGGHIDKGELTQEALRREIKEEWGERCALTQEIPPSLLTVTKINSAKHACRLHFDIWHFIPVDKTAFSPDPALIATEYYEMDWYNMEAARSLVTDSNMAFGLEKIASQFV